MSPQDRELVRMVRRIRDRLHTALMIEYVLRGIIAVLFMGIIYVIISRFIPFYNVYWNIVKAAALGAFTSFLYAAFRTPKDSSAALKADSMGLAERTITALELVGDNSAFALLEKNDALEHLKKVDYRKSIPIKPNRRYFAVCLILVAVLALSGFIPNPMADRAAEMYSIRKKAEEQQKKVDKIVEAVKNNPKLTEEQKKEVEARLEELKKELRTAEDNKEMNKAFGRAEKKLEYVKDKYTSIDDLNKIAEVFSKNKMTKEIADMIREGDVKAFKDRLRNTAEILKNLTTEEKQRFAEEIEKLAQELKNNPELAQAFSELAKKLASGEMGDLSKELSQLDQSISELMENEAVQEALSEISKELASMNDNQSSIGQGQQGQNDNGHQGQGNQPGNGNKQGQGNQPGSSGQGQGQGQGQGSGAGSGTDMGSENTESIPQGSSGISKKNTSEKKDGEYEKVFTPHTLGGEGETSNLSGSKGTGGNIEQVITDRGQTIRGSSVPYNQVIGQYREKAMDSISTSDIPPGMKDMVKEYFTSLDE